MGVAEGGKLVVTTSLRPAPELLARARQWAALFAAPLARRESGLAALCRRYQARGVLVVTAERITYYEPECNLEYFFHPGMAKVRLHNCQRDRLDPMLRAMALQPGDRVLDCTLGRGADAVLCAWAVGDTGRVVGLEKSPVLAYLTIDGLQRYVDPSRLVTELLRRIEAQPADYHDYLQRCQDRCFDVVYFDPIFHEPVAASQSMMALRQLADQAPVTAEAVRDAARVARRRVVIKQRKGTPLWRQIGVTSTVASPASRIEYGIVAAGQVNPVASGIYSKVADECREQRGSCLDG